MLLGPALRRAKHPCPELPPRQLGVGAPLKMGVWGHCYGSPTPWAQLIGSSAFTVSSPGWDPPRRPGASFPQRVGARAWGASTCWKQLPASCSKVTPSISAGPAAACLAQHHLQSTILPARALSAVAQCLARTGTSCLQPGDRFRSSELPGSSGLCHRGLQSPRDRCGDPLGGRLHRLPLYSSPLPNIKTMLISLF